MTRSTATRPTGAANFTQPAHTIVEFILDETGSMGSCKSQTLTGFNQYLAEQRDTAGTCLLTLTKFDTSGLKTPYVDLDVAMAPNLTDATFLPGGGTNLFDAIGERIAAVTARIADYAVRPNVLVVVITDGDDNASQRYTPGSIRDLIHANEAQGWSFVYLGATASALRTARHLGFQEGNAKAFDTREIHQTITDLSAATVAYRATRSAGVTASATSFFSDNR